MDAIPIITTRDASGELLILHAAFTDDAFPLTVGSWRSGGPPRAAASRADGSVCQR